MFSVLKHLIDLSIAKVKVKTNKKGFKLDNLFRYEYQNRVKLFDGYTARCIAEVFLNLDYKHLDKTKDWIEKAIEADRRDSMMFHLGLDYALYSDLFKKKDDLPKAKEKLSKAIEIFTECGADGWVVKYEKELASLA